MLTNILIVLHIVVAIAIIVLVLLQQGRGADMGAAFGGGSQTLFGARGSANFLSRMTAVLATVFFITSMSLAYIYTQRSAPTSVTEGASSQPAAPVETPASAPSTATDAPGETDVPAVPGAETSGAEPGSAAGDTSEPSPVPEAPK